jgi:CcmD family protein
MKTIKRIVAAAVLALAVVAPAAAQSSGQSPQPQEQQDEFVPISQLPPQEQVPSAPLLVAAYMVVLLALFGYVLSVSRRLASVQREVQRLEEDVKRAGRA